jgi:OOP family OmpA-OmpF porin
MNTLLRLSAAVVASLGVSAGAAAQTDAYGTDGSGRVIRDAFGRCLATGQWTPAKAIEQCDPELVQKPAPKKVEVAPPPEPIAAPFVPPEPPKLIAVPSPPRIQTITLGADTSFDLGKTDLKPEGRVRLDELAAKLKGVRIDSIYVTGHTDNVGADEANRQLSLRRAEAVKTYLASKGVSLAKIRTIGRGRSSPVADNKTPQGRAKNRRVEVDLRGARTVL